MGDDFITYAKRMELLPPYLFGTINKMKREKRWNGDDVIDLGMGNPIDPTPEPIVNKLCEVVKDPKIHRYPVATGLNNFKKEIARMYKKDYAVEIDPEREVIGTIGSKEGLSHMCLALVGPGERIVVPTPAFPIHIYAATIADAIVEHVPLTPESLFLEELVKKCESKEHKPKLVMLNYPHNPTSTTTTKEFYTEIVRLAKKYRFMVIQDFAYSKITYDGYKAPSFLEVEGAKDVGVEFGSFSKSYNMAGWRIGYCVGNEKMISGLSKIKGYYDYGIFSAIQVAGIVALRDCDEKVKEQAKIYEHRRDVLCDGLEKMGWEVKKPEAGMFVWVKIPEPYSKMGSLDFAVTMMEKANVALAPGIGFGKEGEGYLRIALVENENRIKQALKQMKRALKELEI